MLSIALDGIADPVLDPPPSAGIGLSVVPFVQIPHSPSTGTALRLNLLREAPDGSGRLFVIDQHGYLFVISPDREVGI